MKGQRKRVGDRDTYFPPFVNERFDGPPWWACTFTALLNGANVGFLGGKEASHREVRALARASGDATLAGGSQSSHMIRAMRARYGLRVRLERLSPARAQERLASGWALVAAVTYGDLPTHYRRWSPRFKKGHRITLLGWDGRRTMLLDPLATKDSSYTGEPIDWSDFERAWWSGEQLWIAEGMFNQPPRVRLLERVPEGSWRLAAGSRLVARLGDRPQCVARNVRLTEPRSGRFDAFVELVYPSGTRRGPFLRLSSGVLSGMLLPQGIKGLSLRNTGRTRVAPTRAPRTPAGATASDAAVAAASPVGPTSSVDGGSLVPAPAVPVPDELPPDPSAAFLEGRRAEWQRLNDALAPVVNLPPPP